MQGSVTTAELLAIAAFKDGTCSQAFPSFGVERRGVFVRISDKKIRLRSQVYMGCVSIHPAWNEESSVTIDVYVCYWLITYKTSVHPSRMRNRGCTSYVLKCGV